MSKDLSERNHRSAKSDSHGLLGFMLLRRTLRLCRSLSHLVYIPEVVKPISMCLLARSSARLEVVW